MNIFDATLQLISANCQEYLVTLRTCSKGSILLRGYKKEIVRVKKFYHDLEDRTPLNTPKEIHNSINQFYSPRFGWKVRNGIFCYGYNLENEKAKDLGYGPFYIFFPVGKFDFVYSPTFFDMYGYINESDDELDTTIKKLDFKNDSLCAAITSGEKLDNLSNEISIKANTYYLIDYSFRKEVMHFIWDGKLG